MSENNQGIDNKKVPFPRAGEIPEDERKDLGRQGQKLGEVSFEKKDRLLNFVDKLDENRRSMSFEGAADTLAYRDLGLEYGAEDVDSAIAAQRTLNLAYLNETFVNWLNSGKPAHLYDADETQRPRSLAGHDGLFTIVWNYPDEQRREEFRAEALRRAHSLLGSAINVDPDTREGQINTEFTRVVGTFDNWEKIQDNALKSVAASSKS